MIVTVHSFLRGVGRTSIVANLAALLGIAGRRVGVIDADFSAPSLHYPFQLGEREHTWSLNDYLQGSCEIGDVAHEVTPDPVGVSAGRVLLIPASVKAADIARILRDGYNLEHLSAGLERLKADFDLDVLLVDSESGLSATSLSLIALSDRLAVVMRLDKQDYQGTSVTVEVAHRLSVPRLVLVVNMVPQAYDLAGVQTKVQQAYDGESTHGLPFAEEMGALGTSDLFVTRYPNHLLTRELRRLADVLVP